MMYGNLENHPYLIVCDAGICSSEAIEKYLISKNRRMLLSIPNNKMQNINQYFRSYFKEIDI